MKPNMGAGDGGATDLPGGRRVRKDCPQIEALGAIDEASAAVGLARSFIKDNNRRQVLFSCQQALQQAAAVVASAENENAGTVSVDFMGAVSAVEEEMRRLSQKMPELAAFIIPGENPAEAALHLARTAVRRAERRTFALKPADNSPMAHAAAYLNRFSDLLFLMARTGETH